MFYIIVSVKPEVIVGDNTFALTDLFTQRQLFNGPLWFLLSLFEVEAAFYLIYTFINAEWLRAIIVFAFASVGFILSATHTFLPLWLDASCVALMYFYFGYVFSLSNLTTKSISIPYLLLIGFAFYILFLLMPVTIGMSVNYYSNYYLAISSGGLIILFLLVISKLLSKLTFLAWFGSNSLVLLCTHHIVYRPIKYLQMKTGNENAYVLFIATILIEVAVIYAINRWIPILAGKFNKKYNKVQ